MFPPFKYGRSLGLERVQLYDWAEKSVKHLSFTNYMHICRENLQFNMFMCKIVRESNTRYSKTRGH